jgi:hypothetical protein
MLMKQLFNAFLFVLPDDEVDEPDSLPVLESTTRKGLYDLVLALCEDADCHNQLIYLLSQLNIEGKPFSPTTSSIMSLLSFRTYVVCILTCVLPQILLLRRHMRLTGRTKFDPRPDMLAFITHATSAI